MKNRPAKTRIRQTNRNVQRSNRVNQQTALHVRAKPRYGVGPGWGIRPNAGKRVEGNANRMAKPWGQVGGRCNRVAQAKTINVRACAQRKERQRAPEGAARCVCGHVQMCTKMRVRYGVRCAAKPHHRVCPGKVWGSGCKKRGKCVAWWASPGRRNA